MNLFMMKESAREHAQAARGVALLLGDGIAGSMTGAALRAAANGYNRGLEREADSIGIVRMAAAGYPRTDFHSLFVILRDYVAAEKIKDQYFFSSHPEIVERLENYARIAGNVGLAGNLPQSEGGQREDDIEKGYFCIKLRNVILYDAEINLAAGKFELAGAQFDRLLSVDGGDIVTLVMRGDMERKMSPRSVSPAEWYGKALRRYPGHAGALRGMGFMYYSIGDKEKARKYLREYCELAAGAADIRMAREILRRCEE
jgi:predicted Zn-dependent protease